MIIAASGIVDTLAGAISLAIILAIAFFMQRRVERKLRSIDNAVNNRPLTEPKLYDVASDTKALVEDAAQKTIEVVEHTRQQIERQFIDHRRLVFDKIDQNQVENNSRLRGIEERVKGVDDRIGGVEQRIDRNVERIDEARERLGRMERRIEEDRPQSQESHPPESSET